MFYFYSLDGSTTTRKHRYLARPPWHVREWHGDRCLTQLPPRKIYSCPRRQPVPAPFAAFCPHPHPVITARVVPIPTPLPQSHANKNTPFPDLEKTMDIFWHFVRMFWDFIWIYVNSFYFMHFVRNVIVLLICNIAAFACITINIRLSTTYT